jgi:outer membrane protein TolC
VFLARKTRALLEENASLFRRMEALALTRYAAGMGTAAEAAMAQTEKYMIAERLAMARQKIGSIEAMLASLLGRTTPAAIAVPEALSIDAGSFGTEALMEQAMDQSPRLAAKRQMIEAARVRIRMAEKEFYPDMTMAANWFNNGGAFEDMWSVTTTVNLPLFFKDKQREQVRETKALLRQARAELEAEKNMIVAEIRDIGAMVEAAQSLMALYEQAQIPKNRQEIALLMADYAAGQGEAAPVIGRGRALVESQIGYWTQVAVAAKAKARADALVGAGLTDPAPWTHDHDQEGAP